MLIEHSLKRAAELGDEAVVIMGSPANYVGQRLSVLQEVQCLRGKR